MEPQIINDRDGNPAFAVIPYDQFLTLTEDAEDRALAAEARAEGGENVTADEMDRILDGASMVTIFRERRAMTQAELAEKAGTSSAYISQIETGKRNAGAKMRRKLADVLGVGVDDLVG